MVDTQASETGLTPPQEANIDMRRCAAGSGEQLLHLVHSCIPNALPHAWHVVGDS